MSSAALEVDEKSQAPKRSGWKGRLSETTGENVGGPGRRSDPTEAALFGRFGPRSHAPGKAIIALAPQNDKGIIVPVHRPWTWRDFAKLGESPVAGVGVPQPQIISDRRRNV